MSFAATIIRSSDLVKLRRGPAANMNWSGAETIVSISGSSKEAKSSRIERRSPAFLMSLTNFWTVAVSPPRVTPPGCVTLAILTRPAHTDLSTALSRVPRSRG